MTPEPDIGDETEDYKLFTKDSLKGLQSRAVYLKSNKNAVKNSAAKQAIFKGVDESFTPVEIDDLSCEDLQPDASLSDGQELPQYYGKFPKSLYNQPLEDVDAYYKERGEETFCVIARRFGKNKVYRFSAANSCFIFSPFQWIRRFAIAITLHPLFDAIIMLTILVNCVFLGLDNEIPNAEYFFTAFYTLEMLIKVTARGFIMERFTYLRDLWNWLDLIVLVVAYASIAGTESVSSLRTFRVLRALKSVSIVPGLKTIVNALFHSMKPLAEVLLIMGFLLIVVSLIALQAYQGVLRRRCVRYPAPLGNLSGQYLLSDTNYTRNPNNWNPVEGEKVICGNGTGSGYCPEDYVCLPDVGENPNFGNTNFDNMGYALLTSLQLLTLDFWENIIRAEGPWNVLFFLMSVFLGPFYLLNLLLAVVTLAYKKEHEKQAGLEHERTLAKERAKRKQLRRKKLQEHKITKRPNAVGPTEKNSPPVISSLLDVVDSLKATSQSDSFNAMDSTRPDIYTPNSSQSHHNTSVAKNGAPRNKQESFSNSRKNVSVESAESSNGSLGKWERRFQTMKSWYMSTFCSWQCHPKFTKFQKTLFCVVDHKVFEVFIIVCILINTVFLAIDHHGISVDLENALNIGNKVFTFVFLAEAILKIIAMSPFTYMQNLWNVFDFTIVVISIIEFLLDTVSSGTGLTVLRTLRLLRVFRLARMWNTMNKLVTIIWKSISAVSYLTIVLFLVLYIFAVIGKQWYSKKYNESASLFEDNEIPRWHFGDFYHSFLLVWRVMCGEWIEPLYDCLYINNGDGRCIVLFLSITFFANFMILNLFTAILLDSFSVDTLNAKKTHKSSVSPESKIGEKRNSSVASIQQINDKINVESEVTGYSQNNSTNLQPDVAKSGRRESVSVSQILGLQRNDKQLQTKPDKDEDVSTSSEFSVEKENATRKHPLRRQTSMDKPHENLSHNRKALSAVETIPENVEEQIELTYAGQENPCDNRQYSSDMNVSSQTHIECLTPKDETKSTVCYHPPDSCLCREARGEIGEQSENRGDPNDEKEEENYDEPPPCLPSPFLQRFPSIQHASTGQIFLYWHALRKACFALVEHPFFEWFILFLILGSTVCLTLEDVYLEDDQVKKDILQKLEYVFTALFTMEMLLKWIGIGLTRYFTTVWCILDCAIVAASWAGILLKAQAAQFRVLRALRAFRPLRAVSRWQGMKVVVNALIHCIPSIANVLCVCLLIWFVFGIIGVQFFKGQFYRCVDAGDNMVHDLNVVNKTTCLSSPGNYSWVNRNINFDNVGNAMVALFQVATFEGWIEIMADSADVTGEDIQPVRDASQYNTIFYVVFVLIGSFFILNLIVGVIIESFNTLSKETESSSAVETLLTDSQKQFYKTMRTMLNRKPKKTIPPPTNGVQLRIFYLVTNSRFELSVFMLIVLNMVTLSMEHYQMSDLWRDSLRICDITFTSLFALEAALKLTGMRYYYFRDVFNVFDFLVVVVSITGFILENLIALIVSPTLLRVVRVFRVFRVLRVVRAARGIRRLILTLMISIPALFNIAVLLSVFMVIFAILGMTMFMHVKLGGALNDQVNFQTFGNALMVLFRLVTSAGWNDVLEPLMNVRNCNPDATISDCGDPVGAVIYFVVFIFVVFLVIVNMYIAIILENFDEIFQQDECGVSQGDFETFYMVWGRYDPKATQFVTLTELSNLLHDLHPPFQLPKPNLVKIGALDLPVLYGDKVHCLDVLFALVKRILGEVEISEEMRLEAEERLLKSFPNRKTLKADTTTLVLRQQIRAAKVIQDAWKAFSSKKRKEGIEADLDKLHETPATESPMNICAVDEMIKVNGMQGITRQQTEMDVHGETKLDASQNATYRQHSIELAVNIESGESQLASRQHLKTNSSAEQNILGELKLEKHNDKKEVHVQQNKSIENNEQYNAVEVTGSTLQPKGGSITSEKNKRFLSLPNDQKQTEIRSNSYLPARSDTTSTDTGSVGKTPSLSPVNANNSNSNISSLDSAKTQERAFLFRNVSTIKQHESQTITLNQRPQTAVESSLSKTKQAVRPKSSTASNGKMLFKKNDVSIIAERKTHDNSNLRHNTSAL